MVYSDLDGTMVGPRGCFFRAADTSVTLEPARALADLLEAGITLVLVSGRTRSQLAEAARIFGADGYIGEMGAVIGWDHGLRHEILRGAMPPELTGMLPEVLAATGLVPDLLGQFAGRLEYHAPWHLGHEADVMLRGYVDTDEVDGWLAKRDHGWLRLLDNGRLPPAAPGFAGEPRHVYHLMADGISKGAGVAADLARRGLYPDEAIAIGDSRSDLTMTPFVRRFFLVANGAHAAAAAPANLTICQDTVGLGWVEAVRWTVARSAVGRKG